jgi:small subunit ribosomal protein S6
VVVLNAALEDDQIESILKRIEEIITSNGGEILDIDKWGRKRLAYPIQKAKSGYYAIFRFKAPTELIKELERNYRLDENIIRFLTILLDKFALEAIAQKKESAENENSGDSETNNESKE